MFRIASPIRARAGYVAKCLWLGTSSLRSVVELLLLLAGGSLLGYLVPGLDTPLLLLALLLLALLFALADGAYRLDQTAKADRANAETAAVARALELAAPRILLGKPAIPAQSQPYRLKWGDGESFIEHGRVIRVPVRNELGAEVAENVRATLWFQPKDHGSFSPKEPMPGEWDEPAGPVEEVDLAGNGSPRYLDVLFIRDRPHPHAFAWTRLSRQAGLSGYMIASGRIQIDIEVTASGRAQTQVKDTLTVECHQRQMLTAFWSSRSRDDDDRGATEWWDGEAM